MPSVVYTLRFTFLTKYPSRADVLTDRPLSLSLFTSATQVFLGNFDLRLIVTRLLPGNIGTIFTIPGICLPSTGIVAARLFKLIQSPPTSLGLTTKQVCLSAGAAPWAHSDEINQCFTRRIHPRKLPVDLIGIFRL